MLLFGFLALLVVFVTCPNWRCGSFSLLVQDNNLLILVHFHFSHLPSQFLESSSLTSSVSSTCVLEEIFMTLDLSHISFAILISLS